MEKPRPLLERLLSTPDLAKIVPRLQPEVLHRVVQTFGLEDCTDFVALATPEQVARIVDLDIWRVRTPGVDEEFDAERFGLWIAVLMQSGAAVAAEKLGGLDIDLVIAGLSRHAAVFDRAAISPYMTLDGQLVPGRALERGPLAEIGGYAIEARRTAAWDAIVELLAFLEAENREYFHRLMHGCVRLSNGAREADGFHDLLEDGEQHMFDLARDRDSRRGEQGFVTPAEARAFLKSGRDLGLDANRPSPSPIARAYFRDLESAAASNPETFAEPVVDLPESSGDVAAGEELDGFAGVVEVLREAGILTPLRGLLGAGEREPSRLSWIEPHLASSPAAADELAYLTNAIIAGCSVQGRPFTTREASEGAVAICNLGLENWPSHWPERDLVTAFQVGWTILHRDVCMRAARHLIDVLATIRCQDRDIHLQLGGLRRNLARHAANREPWHARSSLDAILMLDGPAWAVLLALIDECPVLPAALDPSRPPTRSINPSEFQFISQNSQITAVHKFLASLQSVLTT